MEKIFGKSAGVAPIKRTEREVKMVGRVGFEPTTNWLKANCSTN